MNNRHFWSTNIQNPFVLVIIAWLSDVDEFSGFYGFHHFNQRQLRFLARLIYVKKEINLILGLVASLLVSITDEEGYSVAC